MALGTAFIVDNLNGQFWTIDLTTGANANPVTFTNHGTQRPVMKPDNSEIWCVSTAAGGFIYVVNVASLTLTHTINVGGTQTFGGTGGFSADGSEFYCEDFTNNRIYTFSTTTYTSTGNVACGVNNTGTFAFSNPNTGTTQFTAAGGTQIQQQISGVVGTALTTNGGANNQGGCYGTGLGNGFLYIVSRNAGGVVIVNSAAMTIVSTLGTTHVTYAAIPSPTGDRVYISEANLLAWVDTATNTLNATTLVTTAANPYGVCITQDGTTLVVTNQSTGGIFLYNIPALTLATSFSTPTSNMFGVCTFFPTVTPVPPTTKHRLPLFVPRKGLRFWDLSDFDINWNAIERWASNQGFPIIFPFREKRMPTERELDANWHRMEIWASSSGIYPPPDGVVAPLLIQRKNSLDPSDLSINFLRIQSWANGQ